MGGVVGGGIYLLVALLDIGPIVGKAASHHTTHNKVEWLYPGPVFFEIVKLKGAVGRDTRDQVNTL